MKEYEYVIKDELGIYARPVGTDVAAIEYMEVIMKSNLWNMEIVGYF